ncbi:MAG TPA: GNAT family N-acetyltransferase [Burkholderiales bacterium]|nr:GNAT family N-acetyltransferase [Burkholderiales bacterium]
MGEIRPVRQGADLEAVRTLFREYERWVGEPACFAGFERELAELPGEYAPPDGLLLLALEQGVPAGCAGLRRLGDGAGEMKRLYVREAFRGRGLGRRLAEVLIGAARAAGRPVLRLDSLPKMRAALAMYAELGFAPRGPYAADPTPGALFFERPL